MIDQVMINFWKHQLCNCGNTKWVPLFSGHPSSNSLIEKFIYCWLYGSLETVRWGWWCKEGHFFMAYHVLLRHGSWPVQTLELWAVCHCHCLDLFVFGCPLSNSILNDLVKQDDTLVLPLKTPLPLHTPIPPRGKGGGWGPDTLGYTPTHL